MMAFVDTFVCVHKEEIVDTSDQTLQVKIQGTKKRRRTVRERREIVEETLLPGASVSRVARRHDVNANQVFYWRTLYRHLLPFSIIFQLPVGLPCISAAVSAI